MPPVETSREAHTVRRCCMRAQVVTALRAFFAERSFVEVDTAVCVRAPAPELYIEAVPVHLAAGMGQPAQDRYLQTSPELPMKRLLSAGLARIYQIAPVFRAGDHSPTHRPEFRLLEWYRREGTPAQLMDDCEALLVRAAQAAGRQTEASFGGRPMRLTAPFLRLTVEDAFCQYAGFSLLESQTEPALRRRLDQAQVRWCPTDTWDELFDRAFLQCIMPHLQRLPQPLFLTDYPARLAALARCRPDDARVAERFELFVGGIELANGFGELTDAAEQRRRFVAEGARRRAAGKQVYPLDEAFLASLPQLPSAAGIALGLERLLMLVYDAPNLDEVSCLAWDDT